MNFQRTYRLDIFTPAGKQITILPPLSIRFSVTRNTLSSTNTGRITIYNLGNGTRNQIFKDRYSTTEYWQVRLQAGYNGRLHLVFQGNILEAYSYKQNTEWITEIDAYDGIDAIQNGFTATTIAAGTSKTDIIGKVLNDFPNIVSGFIGQPAQGEATRGKTLFGQTSDIITAETDDQWFIDNETVNVISPDEVIPGPVTVLDPSTLLGTPRRRETFLDVMTLFDPQVQVGRVYEINSLEARFNGQYKITGFTHDVEISGASGGKATTLMQLYYGAGGLIGA